MNNQALMDTQRSKMTIPKTYKLFIDGSFPRSESGRYLQIRDRDGGFVANYSWASRKDFRNAIEAARKIQLVWSNKKSFLRGQILFRMAEMLESRRHTFETCLIAQAGLSSECATIEIDQSIDTLFWYAGWADKYAQIVSSVNPVSPQFLNFTRPEPIGTVALFPPKSSPLLGLIAAFAPIILSGNSCVLIVENQAPTLAMELSEVFATSDLPGGVVNILTGKRSELLKDVAGHMDLNAIGCFEAEQEERKTLKYISSENVKRVHFFPNSNLFTSSEEKWKSLSLITPFVEWKTGWLPMGS